MATLGSGVLVSGDNIIDMVAGGTILAGEVVGFNATGVSNTIEAAIVTHAGCIGVALNDASSGEHVAVATIGCVCMVTEGKGGTIDAGDFIVPAADVAGGVSAYSDAADLASGVCGVALTDFAANGKGKMLVIAGPVVKGA